MRRFLGWAGVVFILLLGVAAGPARAEVASQWLPFDATSMATVDHGPWEQFLMRYIRIDGSSIHRIAYGDVTEADRAALDRYVASLTEVPVATYNRDVQMAYWINLYNALLVRLVLEHYPIGSVLDIDGGTGRSGPWDLKLIEIDGHALSLRDIQDRILRPIWHDPRLHYALSCAALGCPNLQPVPYQGARLNEQLTEAAIDYINDRRCLEMAGDGLVVSSMFRWYQEDFGGSDRGVISHLLAFAEPRLAMRLQQFDRINGDVFDWRLNDGTLP